MNNDESFHTEIIDNVNSVLHISEELKKELKNKVIDEKDNLHNALLTLIVLEASSYNKLAKIFNMSDTSKIIEFASVSRLLLESHAIICWILDSKDDRENRGTKFMETGWDLQKHYNNLISNHDGDVKRARHRLPSTEKMMKTMHNRTLINWYDELNYYVHPSAAIITQLFVGGIQKTIDIGMIFSVGVYTDSILKIADILDLNEVIRSEVRIVQQGVR